MLFLTGCSQASRDNPSAQTQVNSPSPDPADRLQQMVSAYRAAKSYSDRGVVRLRYKEGGQTLEDSAPFGTMVRTPNRAVIHAYQTKVVCDGQKLYARIRDGATSNLDNQVLVRDAPADLSLSFLFADPLLQQSLTTGLGRQPIQLELLFAAQPLATLFDKDTRKRLLPEEKCEGRICDRIEAQTPEGAFTFWIDRETHVLRRLEYPVYALAPELADASEIRDAELIADFRDACFDLNLDDSHFRFRIPTNAKQVNRFVMPPRELPSQLFGQSPGDFTLSQLGGGQLSRRSFERRIAVLIWFSDHPACQASLTQLSQVYNEFSSSDEIRFAAVCTEPSSTADEALQSLLESWQVNVPLLRDLAACGRDVFQIPFAPTLVVLDRAGLVQIFEVGANPRLAEELPVVLNRLLAGEDLAAEIRAGYDREQAEYSRRLAAAQGQDQEHNVGLSRPRPESGPRKLRLNKQWEFRELQQLGNLVVVSEQNDLRLWCIESDRTVVELNSTGQMVNRIELPIGADFVHWVRTATDGDGKRTFVAMGLQGTAAYWFDDRWSLVSRYPSAEQPPGGLVDVQLTDLEADGELEMLLAFGGAHGVQAVDSRGRIKWTSQVLHNALSLAVVARPNGPSEVLVTGQSGRAYRLDSAGSVVPKAVDPQRSLFYLFREEFRPTIPRSPTFCGVSYDEQGNLLAVNVDDQLQLQWSYSLPSGTFTNPIQFVTSANLLNGKHWILAGPDGSVHFVSIDGTFTDQFSSGETLTGIAAIGYGGQSWLFTAAKQRLVAWTVDFR